MTAAPLFHWLNSRAAGILLHPTCLPGDQGVGTFDAAAERFLDFLEAAGIRYWQICPLGPTGFGDSPYQCFSAFAGNPYLIDLHDLVARGFLAESDLLALARLGATRVDYGGLHRLKWSVLKRASERFLKAGAPALGPEAFEAFKARNADWLEPYALYRALKDHHRGRPWMEWPAETRAYASALGSALNTKLAGAMEAQRFYQYVFFAQWTRLRSAAARRHIAIIGDLPIFVAGDSADVWSHPDLFELDSVTGQARAVAGVPPDYFSADGQLWGNPLYAWDRHAADGYSWWKARMKASFELYDIVRIDHFRGFESFWRIPLPATNARIGAWTPGPGLDLFRALHEAFPDARIIAEDLGLITPAVEKLREETGLPGMAVLQFAFGGDASNLYLPHNLSPNQVTYTGTHDNDTTLGWYAAAPEGTRDHLRRYLRVDGHEAGWDLIRTAYQSVSRLAIIPVQDVLGLASDGRFNSPGKPEGNWQWRLLPDQLEGLFGSAEYLTELGRLTGRS